MPLTRALGEFVAGLTYARIPAEAVRIARTGFVDCVGTMIAGREEDAVQILRRTLGVGGAAGEATLYFSDLRAPAPEAAWINGVAGHALDYDDVALRGHPSTVLVPAILAEGEALGASGEQMLAAYLAGYETWAELVRRDQGFHHVKGWHPTGIFGAVAAAAACASLRRLDAARAAMAIALGASQSAGLTANFGTMTKPFHAGRAAHAGAIAARLAQAGFTAHLDALEHPQGFLSAVSQHGEVDRASEPTALGREWRILAEGLSIKKYPTCYCTHRAIDGALRLFRENPVKCEEVREIRVSISDRYATILRNHRPKTGLEAKFSMEFAMSSALVAKRVGLPELTDSFVQRPDVQSLIERVAIDTTTEYDPDGSGAAPFDQVTVSLASGATLKGPEVRHATGHARLPLSDSELFEKFQGCLEAGKAHNRAGALFERLMSLERTEARALATLA
ncbi:MmgE/PrpD family protein [Caldovatus aquaticus]|uniref:MmgE/PrpD family protein n=1 Tax=Caldovatus aquaticus TaxID=2865671 RepID=A0ABS7F760_9PROT|nr:MmgE/PrpD family protein [Caldovatus aquaticus]MBW8270787.1 MmgE/PrpD family protein [Caldovatus aquaticus]